MTSTTSDAEWQAACRAAIADLTPRIAAAKAMGDAYDDPLNKLPDMEAALEYYQAQLALANANGETK
jgi:hypothetical protein